MSAKRFSPLAEHHKFFQLDDPDDYTSLITLADPVNSEGVIVGATVLQVAPDNFLHPVHVRSQCARCHSQFEEFDDPETEEGRE